MSKINLDHVTKIFDSKVVAVDDLTLEVPHKGLVSLLGPSGCGKTTTMRIISGLEVPSAGRVYFDDQDYTEIPPKHREVAMVFQFPVLYPRMSVYDNIAFPLVARKLPSREIRNKVDEVATIFKLKNSLNKDASELDAGDKQRAILARAFIRRPRLYLLDEPLTNVDPKARLELRAELKRMQIDLGQTMIYVTHDQSEALTLSDKIAVMDKGKLLQYDTPEMIYRYPANTFVGWFIGNPGMNFLKCKVVSKNGEMFLQVDGFECSLKNMSSVAKKVMATGEVMIGIRPEHIEISHQELKEGFQATCIFIEPMGNRRIFHLKIGNNLLKAKTAGKTRVSKGEKLWVRFPQEEIRVFDATTYNLIE